MRKGLIAVSFSVVVLCFVGCAPKGMYYFGDYSETLYILEKNKDEDSLLKHQQDLEKIISESETRNLRVPPGIYAELGFIHLKKNNSKEAIKLFNSESQVYPESKHLMDRLIQSAQAKETEDTDTSSLPMKEVTAQKSE